MAMQSPPPSTPKPQRGAQLGILSAPANYAALRDELVRRNIARVDGRLRSLARCEYCERPVSSSATCDGCGAPRQDWQIVGLSPDQANAISDAWQHALKGSANAFRQFVVGQ